MMPNLTSPSKSPITKKKSQNIPQKHWDAIDMRASGMSLRQIGVALGVSHMTAANYLKAGLNAIQSEQAETIRKIEGETLDRMQQAVWGDAVLGDAKAVASVIRIMERRARLFGLDSPVIVEATHTVVDGGIDAEVARLSEELKINP